MKIPQEVKNKCVEMYAQGISEDEIYQYYKNYSGSTLEGFKRTLRGWRKEVVIDTPKKEKPFDLIETLKKGINLKSLPVDLIYQLRQLRVYYRTLKGKDTTFSN